MTSPRPLVAAALLLAALPAAAQLAWTDRERGLPAGLTLPVLGVATAEEPTALDLNPAGIGFVGGLALQYFHEGIPAQKFHGDGLYLADRFGPLAIGYGAEWLRPGRAPLPHYRRSRLALALTDGRSASLGLGWTWIRSQDGALERARSWELGATYRPFRQLSLAGAAMGNGARIGTVRLPVRFDLGAATRLWEDRVTVSADLLADDAGQRFRATYARVGAGVELPTGVVLGLRVDLPLRDDLGGGRNASGFLTLTAQRPHLGLTAAATRFDGENGWLAGARLSQERYRSGGPEILLASVSLPADLRPRRLLWITLGDRDPYALLVERILAARDDPAVGALLVRIDELPFGAGRVEELRALLSRVRQHKPVLAYLTGGGTREYWLASAATAVASPPGTPLLVNGFSSARLYYRDLLARLGVAVQVVRAGAYKSAAEPLVRTGPSPEAKQVTEDILDQVYLRFVADVARDRRLPPEKVRAMVDQGIFLSDEAHAGGFLDAAVWPDGVRKWASEVSGRRLIDFGGYRPEPFRKAQRWGRPPVVELIRLAGIITRTEAGGAAMGEDALASASGVAAALRRAADDADVRAIVLRIETPGGDGFASDLIWREVVRARQKGKQVVASMGDVAASGGYLVAAGADAIVAEPSTLTGSIGVFAAKPDLGGLLEKLPVQRDASGRGEKAELLSLARPWSEAERAAVQRQIDAFYGIFLDRVAEGRNLSRTEVEALAGGRVWTGQQALERRLVDRLGTLADAVAVARARAGLAADAIEVRRASAREEGLLGQLGRMGLGRAWGLGAEPTFARLALGAPEVQTLLLLADGSLGPVLALPEEWVGRPR